MQAAAAEEAEAAAVLARGKRSKLRRAKEKYAHQDEEDRQLALEVLAPAGAPPTRVSAVFYCNSSESCLTPPAAVTPAGGPGAHRCSPCTPMMHTHQEMVLEGLSSLLAMQGPKRLLWTICSFPAHPHSMLNASCSNHQRML